MKAFIPYALLGIIGAAGAVAGVKHVATATPAPPYTGDSTVQVNPVPLPPSAQDGPVRISASLDRTVLPDAGGDAFVRVALEGIPPAQSEKQARVPVAL